MACKTILKTTALAAVLTSASAFSAQAVFFHVGSGSIDGSLCVGNDCVASPAFGFDTVILRENNLRMLFDDTSSTASFPDNDWRLTANDSANGGAEHFSIEDASAGRFVFRVFAGARSNALVVDAQGDLGLGTATPATDIDIKTGNTPTVRLQQDGTSGFAPQTWDLAGNEAGFFIRDATNGSTLPFRIIPGASSNSLVIDDDDDIGMGAGTNPAWDLHIRDTGASNNAVIGLEANGVTWEITNNAATGRITWGPTGGTDPFKMSSTAVENLLRVGVTADDEVTIAGNLIVSGDCEETDGACADYVFSPDHERLSLPELRAFISDHKHLPNVPSETDIKENGVNMAHFTGRLLEKIEELTLYTIEQQDVIDDLSLRIEELENQG